MIRKKILIHSIVFSPDGVSTAYLYNDIAVGFKNAGYDVVVLTTTPHYNLIGSTLIKQPLKSKLCDYYENDCIFDKFTIGLSPDGTKIVSGLYD